MTSSHVAPPLSGATVPVPAMPSRVLLGIDFSAASLAAARWATTHVMPRPDAVLSHVVPLSDAVSCEREMDRSHADGLRQTTHTLEGGLRGFASTLEVASARHVLRVGRPSRWLSVIADETDVALLVLGRRADANRVRVGEPNVTERTARRTSASVLVVPEGTVHAPSHVLAAVDESPFAAPVLRVARRLARIHEIPLTILHVLSPIGGAYERVIQTARHLLRGSSRRKSPDRQTLPRTFPARSTRWLAHLGDARSGVADERTEIAMGDPAREITGMAVAQGAPLVVVGMRGADEAPAGSIGSVVRDLLTRAPVPVLAVNGGHGVTAPLFSSDETSELVR